MSDEILIEPDNPLDVRPEELTDLLEDMRGLRQDAFLAYRTPLPGQYGVTWPEVLTLWLARELADALVDQAVGYAISYMRERFRKKPASSMRPKVVRIVRYEGETGIAVELVELESPNAKPMRRSPDAFELYTRKKPPRR